MVQKIKRKFYYQKHILILISKHEISDLYPQCHQFNELHQDQASSYTSHSTIFLEKMEQKTGIKTIHFIDIPDKTLIYH